VADPHPRQPDPDALAAAALLARLLRGAFRQKVTLAYGGLVGRAENREMGQEPAAPFRHVRNLQLGKYDRFAWSTPSRGPATTSSPTPPPPIW